MSIAFVEEDKWQRFSEWMAARGAKMVCHPANARRTVGYLYFQNFSPNGQTVCFWRIKSHGQASRSTGNSWKLLIFSSEEKVKIADINGMSSP